MHVLNEMVAAVRSGGLVLDLQVIRPAPRLEAGDRLLCELDGEPLLRKADGARAAIDALVFAGRLIDEAVDDHEVCKHYSTGAEAVDDLTEKEQRIPQDAIADVRAILRPCVMRQRCRLRRLRIPGAARRDSGDLPMS